MNRSSLHTSLLYVALCTGLLLLVPLIAMQFTDEVAWSPRDYIVAGALLSGAGVLMVLGLRQVKNPVGRLAVVGGVGATLLAVWAQLAVGLFF